MAEWLESIRMKRYILHFRSAGLDTMECVLELTAECGHWGRGGLGIGLQLGAELPGSRRPLLFHRDLTQMGITLPGHQKRILCSIQGFKD